MSVALRTITRLQDADDINVSLGAGVDEYALCWDNDTARFVLRAMSGGGVTDHGALTGLADDDHSQYLLATGARTGASSQAQTFTNGIIGPSWKPASDSTTALQLQQADGTAVVTVDTTNKRLILGSGVPIYSTSYPMLRFDPAKDNFFAGEAGNVTLSGTSNFGFGAFALANVTSGVNNLAMMYLALYNNQGGSNNMALGLSTLSSASPNGCVAIGNYALSNSTANNNVAIGYATGKGSGAYAGQNNVFIGCLAGYNAAGNYNVFIGNSAGYNETGSDKLYIANSNTATPLIYGDFSKSTLKINTADAATTTVTDALTLAHNTSGTAAVGFGAAQLFTLASSTTADQSAARIQALWNDATHASRKADLVLTAYDSGGEREGLRIRGAGSAPAIGFLGAAPVTRIAHVADPAGGATVDAEARSAINSILTTLESFGFHATS